MKRLIVGVATGLALASLVVGGCAQPAPAPTATKAPAASTKAAAAPTTAAAPSAAVAASTKAPAASTAAAPAPTTAAAPAKSAFPAKDKSISIVVPFTAGGVSDNSARILAGLMEKDLGVPVQVVNKAGASTQVGLTEVASAKPDGYTLGVPGLPTSCVTYLDSDRGATYSRKNFQPIALFVLDVISVAVGLDTPYKSIKDLADAGKANPGKIKMATTGLMSVNHLAPIAFEQATSAQFSYVHFPGGADANTAILGGHADAQFSAVGNTTPHFKSEKMRVLGVMDQEESPFLPGIKTLAAQGYNVNASTSYGLVAPAGTPKEVVDVLTAAVKKACANKEYIDRISAVYMTPKYLDPTAFGKFWDEVDEWARPLVKVGKEQQR